MTLFTTDYLEYYLTLVAWIINNGIWEVLVASGIFALPFLAIVVQAVIRIGTNLVQYHLVAAVYAVEITYRQNRTLERALGPGQPPENPHRERPGSAALPPEPAPRLVGLA